MYITQNSTVQLPHFQLPHSYRGLCERAFCGCTSLVAVNMPDSSTYVYDDTFAGYSSLISIALCTALDQQLINDDFGHWLKHRFDNLPIHQACYDIQVNINTLSKVIQDNNDILASTDAMGMTALHILCCNPHVRSSQMIKILKAAYPKSASMVNVLGMTPVMLFLTCKGMGQEESKEESASFSDLMRLGLKIDEVEYVLEEYLDNQTMFNLVEQDQTSGLLPFMAAASLSQCSLDLVFMLAMRHPELLMSNLN